MELRALEQIEMEVQIPIEGAHLGATLAAPAAASGLVVFAHGSGSGRGSERNRFVADRLVAAGLAIMLTDLLTPAEERLDHESADLRFDTDRLSARLAAAVEWSAENTDLGELPLALYGASTGAAAALIVAASVPERIAAVVSRGGRPDMVLDLLPRVQAPTLLIVGSADSLVLDLNRQALEALGGTAELEVIAGAGHLFEQEGALELVAESTQGWLSRHLER